MNSSTVYLIFVCIVIVFNLLFLVISVYITYRVFRWIITKSKTIFRNFDVNYFEILIPLGISILLYAKFFTGTIRKVVWFIVENFKIITQAIIEPGMLEQFDVNNRTEITRFLSNWTNNLYKSFESNILGINFAWLVLFFVTWFALVFLFQKFRTEYLFTKTSKLYQTYKLHKFFNILQYFILILIGIYFSIASIIAIPSFQFTEEEKKNAETQLNFEEDLLKYVPVMADFNKYLIKFEQDSTTYPMLKNSVEIWNDLVESAVFNFSQSHDLAVKKFAIINQKTTKLREKLYYQDILIEWYLENKSRIVNNLNKSHASIKMIIELMSPMQADEEAAFTSYLQIIQQLVDKNIIEFSEIPNRPFIGEQWGIFKWIAGWLLKTESVALALITGMFGFGLFGAAISSLVKEKLDSNNQNNDGYFRILIRGLSAAMVVFLAVKGGISVFTSGESEVNPYILFFTCFVAAVFSEDVWKWAHEQLYQKLKIESNNTDDKKIED